MQQTAALPSEARAPRFKLERKRSRDRLLTGQNGHAMRQSLGHRGGTTVTTCTGGPPSSSDGGGTSDDEPFPIFETLSSAIVSLSEAAGNISGTTVSRRPSLPAMPALRATLGTLLPPPPSPSMHDEYLSPREARRRRRNRLLMTTIKGMLFTAVAVQVIRTDRNYSATLNGATSSSSTTSTTTSAEAGIRSQMRHNAQHGNRLSSDEKMTNSARAGLIMREAAGVDDIVAEESMASILGGGDSDPSSRPVTVIDSIDVPQPQQGSIDTISHIIQGTSLENDPERVADAVEALITLPMRRVESEPDEPYQHMHHNQNQRQNQEQVQPQPPPLPPPFIRRMSTSDKLAHERARSLQQQDDSAGTGSILGLNTILGRNQNDEDATATTTKKFLNPYSGMGVGMHYIDVWVGNPAQKRSLAVMTGSDFTAFPCGDCNECGHSLHQYNAAASTTFATIPCGQCASTQLPSHALTGETCDAVPPGSGQQRKCLTSLHSSFIGGAPSYWSGYEARENLYLGGADLGEGMTEANLADATTKRHGFPMTFACQQGASGWFSDPSTVRNGVAGFSSAPTSLIQQMYLAGKLPHPRFSLCFNRHLRSKRGNIAPSTFDNGNSKNAGVVTLGGFDPAYLSTPIGWANDINHSKPSRRQSANHVDHRPDTSYRVRVTGMYLREGGGQSILSAPNQPPQGLRKVRFDWRQLSGQGSAAVDSSYPYTVLDPGLEGAFLDAWRKATGGGTFSLDPQKLTADELKMLPTIILQLEGSQHIDKSVDPNTLPNLAGDLDAERPFDPLIAIPASHYMDYDASSDTFRATLFFDEEAAGSGAASVLGANVIQGHNVAHYLDQGKIGFAEAGMCEPFVTATGQAVIDTDEAIYSAAAKELKRAEKKGLAQGHLQPGFHAQAQGRYLLDDDMYVYSAGGFQDEDYTEYKVKGHGTCQNTVCRTMMIISYLTFGALVGAFFVFAKRHQRAMEAEDAAAANAIGADSVSGQFDLGNGLVPAAGSTDTLTRLGILRNTDLRYSSGESDEGSEGTRDLIMNAQIASQGGGSERMPNFRRM